MDQLRTKPKQWYGVDLSETMIDRAKKEVPKAILEQSSDGISFQTEFDCVYAIAVFAHVLDDTVVKSIFEKIQTKLRPNGYFIMIEQTGMERRQGDFWCRRTSDEYIKMAEKCGLFVSRRTLIVFSAHRFFERRIAPYFRRFFSKGSNYTEQCINANRSLLYKALSTVMLAVSFRPVRTDNGKYEGNTMFVFKKLAK